MSSEDRLNKHRRNFILPVVVFVFSMAATVFVWHYTRLFLQERSQSRFNTRVDRIVIDVNDRIGEHSQILRGVKGFFSASESVTEDEWAKYVGSLDIGDGRSGVRSVAFAQRQVGEDGLVKYPIIYSTMFADVAPMTGFDLSVDPVRKEAIDNSIKNNDLYITGRLEFENKKPGFAMYLPVNKPLPASDSIAEQNIEGIVLITFYAEGFIGSSIGAADADINVEVYDGEGIDPQKLIFDSTSFIHTTERDYRPYYTERKGLLVGNHPWLLYIDTPPDFHSIEFRYLPTTILYSGFLVSILLTGTLYFLINSRSRALRLADKITHRLKESEHRYRQVLSVLDEGILFVTADGKVKTFNKRAEKILGIDADQIVGRKEIEGTWKVLRADGTELPKEDSPVSKVLKTGKPIYDLVIGLCKDDEKLSWVSVNAFPIFKDGSTKSLYKWTSEDRPTPAPYGVVASFKDVSKQKKAQEHIKQLNIDLESRVTERTKELEKEIKTRLEVEEKIKASLQEKEVLLKEIHHRVKNNLQIISSLLNLQSRKIANPEYKDIFKESQNRVRSMSLVHETLYRSEDLSKIQLSNYINNVGYYLFNSYRKENQNVILSIDILDDVELAVDKAIPCGLIINELLSNSLKYAFPDNRDGRVFIVIDVKEDMLELEVKDDGIGLPADFDPNTTSSLGMQLIKSLTEQLNGQMEITSEEGTVFKVKFPLE